MRGCGDLGTEVSCWTERLRGVEVYLGRSYVCM